MARYQTREGSSLGPTGMPRWEAGFRRPPAPTRWRPRPDPAAGTARPVLRLIGQLERLKQAGVIGGYGAGPGADEVWLEVDEATAATMRAGASPLLDAGFWRSLALEAGLGGVRVTITAPGTAEPPQVRRKRSS